MILLVDSDSPDQTANAQADLDLSCLQMPEDTFSNGTAHMLWVILMITHNNESVENNKNTSL